MKRTGNLKRSGTLARSGIARTNTPLKRTGGLKRRFPKLPNVSKQVRQEWRTAVMDFSGGRSVLSGEPADEGHHIIEKWWLRDNGYVDLIWEPDLGMALTEREHANHHSRFRPIRFDELPLRAIACATAHDLLWYLQKHYPVTEVTDNG